MVRLEYLPYQYLFNQLKNDTSFFIELDGMAIFVHNLLIFCEFWFIQDLEV